MRRAPGAAVGAGQRAKLAPSDGAARSVALLLALPSRSCSMCWPGRGVRGVHPGWPGGECIGARYSGWRGPACPACTGDGATRSVAVLTTWLIW